MRAEVNVFETLATGKAVWSVTFRLATTSARPAEPCQAEPSANRIEAEMPGIPYLARRRSRRASRAASRSGVALAGRWSADAVGLEDGPGLPAGACVVAVPGLAEMRGGESAVGDAPAEPDGAAIDGAGLGPTPATAMPGDPSGPNGSAGAAISGAPTHAPTTTTVTTRAMSGRRSPRFM